MVKSYKISSRTAHSPKRPFDRERMMAELKLVGEYGLRNKREVWRVQLTLARIRAAARYLLTLDKNDPKRMLEGSALLRRMVINGLLGENVKKLDYVLDLTPSKLLDRRLQTRVFQLGLAKSIHHARCLIVQRHIRVGRKMVDVPSFLVRLNSEKHIDFAPTSPFGGGEPGRVKRRTLRKAAAGGDDE